MARAGALTTARLKTKTNRSASQSAQALPVPGAVTIAVASHAQATAAGVNGVLLDVAPDIAGRTQPKSAVSMSLDYSAFADAYGGGYAGRLRLVTLPSCALTTPDKPACRVQTPVAASINDLDKQQLVGDVTLPASTVRPSANTSSSQRASAQPAVVMAASAAPTSGAGDYRATPLSASGSWSVGNTGAFAYQMPITTPPSVGGDAPSVELSYNSASVDGLTSTTNAQASWIGDGWDYSPGYLERTYKSCVDDSNTSGDDQSKSGDQCWAGDNATLSLNGQNSRLVPTAAGSTKWRMEADQGWTIDEITVASNSPYFNGLNAGIYWRVTAQNGTQYFFGANHLPASAGGNGQDTSTNAAWGVPVFGDDSGEPCHGTTLRHLQMHSGLALEPRLRGRPPPEHHRLPLHQ